MSDRMSRYVIHSGQFMDELVMGTIDDLYEEFAREKHDSVDGVYMPIPFVLNSEGGSPFAAIALADTISDIQEQGCEVHAVARGQVASAAIFPWLVCARRAASRDCLFMVHGATDHGMGDYVSQESELQASKMLLNLMAERIANRSDKDVAYWKRVLRSNKPNYYTADKAMELGLVDAIV